MVPSVQQTSYQYQHLCRGEASWVHGRLLPVPGRKSSSHVALAPDRGRALGDHVRHARRGAALTQEALAQASGVGAVHIQRIERGVANPTVATLYALSDALGLTIQTFFDE